MLAKRLRNSAFIVCIILLSFFISLAADVAPENTTREINILALNDFHGQLDKTKKIGSDEAGSAPYLATYLKKLKDQDPKNTRLVHVGDMVGASSAISGLSQDEPTIEFLNKIEFDLGTVGNHEFDRGTEEMLRLINGGYHPKTGNFNGANFPYICANVTYRSSGSLILPPYKIKDINGVKVGFIGVVTTNSRKSVMKDRIRDIQFLDEADTINRYTKELKKQGVGPVIVLAHEGGNQAGDTITGPIADIANRLNDDVDIILAGHTHNFLNGTVNKKLIIQSHNSGTAISKVNIKVDIKTNKVISKKARSIMTYLNNSTPDPGVKDMVTTHKKKVSYIINHQIGVVKNPVTRKANSDGESALGNLCADAQRFAMNTDFAVVQPHGIRTNLEKGIITWGDLYNITPFSNHVVRLELTGQELKDMLNMQFTHHYILQVSGFKYKYNPLLPADKIFDLRKEDNTPIVPNKVYTLAINMFLANAPERFSFLNSKEQTLGPTEIEAMIKYIEAQKQPFTKCIEHRIQKTTKVD